MRIYDIAKKQALSLPGYELINVFEAAFPIYRLNISALILSEQKIPVVEEYVLSLINSGIGDIEDIRGFLGLSEQIIEEYILDLLTQELVSHDNNQNTFRLQMTSKGEEVLEKLMLIKPLEVSVPLIFDAITGSLEHSRTGYGTFSAKRIADMSLEGIRPYLNKPKLEDIDISQVRSIIKKVRKDNPDIAPPDGELCDITALEKVWVEYKKLKVLVFYSSNDQDIMVQVFEKTQRVPEYEKVIMRMEREGLRVLPTNNREEVPDSQIATKIAINIDELKKKTTKIEQIQDKVKVLTKQIPIDKYDDQELDAIDRASLESTVRQLDEAQKELENLKNEDRILTTYEHRPILEQALKEAKNRIIIVSPWIKGDAMDADLINGIESALQKKVNVHIGYGISQEKNTYENWSMRKLRHLQSKPYGKYLNIHFLGNTHEKVLICDEQFAVVTSFNWMSFKGSPDRGFRQETGILSRQPDIIQQLLDDVNKRFSEAQL